MLHHQKSDLSSGANINSINDLMKAYNRLHGLRKKKISSFAII